MTSNKRGTLLPFPGRHPLREQLRTSETVAPSPFDGETSVMVRDIDGRISLWNPGAERSYGLPQDEVVGQVSHYLLRTEFPEPLERINERLCKERVWEGQLIHTLPNGARVQVESRWELLPSNAGGSAVVFEINRSFIPFEPAPNANGIEGLRFRAARVMTLLWRKKAWWLVPLVCTAALIWWVYHVTNVPPFVPH